MIPILQINTLFHGFFESTETQITIRNVSLIKSQQPEFPISRKEKPEVLLTHSVELIKVKAITHRKAKNTETNNGKQLKQKKEFFFNLPFQ